MLPYLAPEVLLVGLGILLLLLDAFAAPPPRLIGRLALSGLVLIAAITCLLPADPVLWWEGLYKWDGPARFFKIFFLVTAVFVTWMSLEYEEQIPSGRPEFYILPLFTTAGMCVLASANDFMVLFVALELVTISFYILVAYQRHNAAALEAGVKYLILGALSSAFLVLGITYVFGFTGSTQFDAVEGVLGRPDIAKGLYFGILLILVGLGFKIAVVPFHLWAPDVYQGAPTPVTAFLAVGSKAAGFILVIRAFLLGPFAGFVVWDKWEPLFVTLAACSMVMGNLGAIPQRNIKRMLAYSGIGHAGFILAGIAAFSAYALPATLFYLTAYLFSSLTAFLVITIVGQNLKSDGIHAYAGLSRRSPLLAAALAVSLISLAGIPPLIGFMGKLGIFMSLWEGGLYVLFWVGVGSAVAGLYYYLGVVRAMYWSEPLETEPIPVARATSLLLGVLIFLTILFGIWAQPILLLLSDIVKIPVAGGG